MGVLVFILAILPMSGGSTMNLMKAESPGPSVGKLVPRIQQTAFLLYAIYFAMTIIELILLLCGLIVSCARMIWASPSSPFSLATLALVLRLGL